jgi:hypothetical protein
MVDTRIRKKQLLALIRRCQQLADEHPDTKAAYHLLELAARHVLESSEQSARPLTSSFQQVIWTASQRRITQL